MHAIIAIVYLQKKLFLSNFDNFLYEHDFTFGILEVNTFPSKYNNIQHGRTCLGGRGIFSLISHNAIPTYYAFSQRLQAKEKQNKMEIIKPPQMLGFRMFLSRNSQ